eukprot:TRINITY_DN3605_c0_g2_i1.p2 TRINITY_DN3605_c0_g2~~TRINITY_DN3605_c0_g2_i1.p2  ORF type:complete len:495 (+),score=76.09 TRINITY_DN3605_c0_g2_i1:1547-3031(+)
MYIVLATVTTVSESISQSVNVTVKVLTSQRSMSDLGVSEDLISVTPEEGISGETKFSAQYSYGNVQVISQNLDNYKFKISTSSGLILESSNANDILTFIVPANADENQTILVNFTISDNLYTYTSIRKILATANSDYDVSEDETVQKVANNQSLTLTDIASGAALISSQVSSGTVSNATVKATLKSTSQAIISELASTNSSENLDTQINALTQIVESSLYDDSDVTTIDEKISNISSNVEDIDTLSSFITLVQSSVNSTTRTSSDEYDLFTNIVTSAKSVASSTLDEDNTEQAYSADGLVGKNVFINRSSIPENGEIISLTKTNDSSANTSASIKLDKSAFSQNGMIVTAILTDKSKVFSSSNSSTLQLLEVTISDLSGATQNISSSDEIIEYNITISNSTGNYECQYYNITVNSFSDYGCQKKGAVQYNSDDNTYYITCACTHLSLYTGDAIVEAVTPTSSTTSDDSSVTDTSDGQIILPVLAIIIALISLLL